MTDLNHKTFEQAIQSDKPALVDFWADWCMPCKIFAPVLEEAAENLDGKADFYRVNVDECQELAQRYNITSIPTVILFKNGKAEEQMIGVRTKQDVANMVEKHL